MPVLKFLSNYRNPLILIAVALGIAVWSVNSMKQKNEQIQKVQAAYVPLRADSTAEFTIERIAMHNGETIVFGLLTKGSIYEGFNLRHIQADGTEQDCLCKAIAGFDSRLPSANAAGPERNIGLLLNIHPNSIKTRDRIISFDTPSNAKTVSPPTLKFSLMGGLSQ